MCKLIGILNSGMLDEGLPFLEHAPTRLCCVHELLSMLRNVLTSQTHTVCSLGSLCMHHWLRSWTMCCGKIDACGLLNGSSKAHCSLYRCLYARSATTLRRISLPPPAIELNAAHLMLLDTPRCRPDTFETRKVWQAPASRPHRRGHFRLEDVLLLEEGTPGAAHQVCAVQVHAPFALQLLQQLLSSASGLLGV